MYSRMREYGVVVLGAAGVGKSALTVRFVRDEFLEHYNPTIEERYSRTVTVGGEDVALVITDTPEVQREFLEVHRESIMSSHGFLLVFSLTQAMNLKELTAIKQLILDIKAGEPDTPIILVGTKVDLYMEREVMPATIKEIAKRWKIPYFLTSAKTGCNVSNVFQELTKRMCQRYPDARGKYRRGCVVM